MNHNKSRYTEYTPQNVNRSRNYSTNNSRRYNQKVYREEIPRSHIRQNSQNSSKNNAIRSFRANYGEIEDFNESSNRGYFLRENQKRNLRNDNNYENEYNVQNESFGRSGQYYERSIRDIKDKDLKKDNKRLRSEIRKLRKEQVGWFGKQKKVKVENVTIENDYFIKENKNLKNELVIIQNDNQELVNRIHILENDNAKLETLLGNQNTQTNSINHTKIEKIKSEFITEKEKIIIQSKSEREKIENYYKSEIKDLERKLEESRRSINLQNLQQQNKNNYEFERSHKNLEVKNAMNNYSEYNFLKSNRNLHEQKHVLNSQLDSRNIEIKKKEEIISDLRSKIEILEKNEEDHKCDYYHQSNEERITEFKTSMDLYLKKLKEKSEEIDNLREKVKNLESNIHSLKLLTTELEMENKILLKNKNEENFEIENNNIKIRNLSLENEIEKLKEIIKKNQNENVNTNTRVEVIKEIHNDNNFGLEKYEIEEMALKNVVLELELKRLKNLMENKNVKNLKNENMDKNYNDVTIIKKFSNSRNYDFEKNGRNYEIEKNSRNSRNYDNSRNYEIHKNSNRDINLRNSQNHEIQRNSQIRKIYVKNNFKNFENEEIEKKRRIVGVREYITNNRGVMEEVDYVPTKENDELKQFSLKY